MSEEPLVCAEYGAHYIPALQGIVKRPGAGQLPFIKTVATAKHYFDYDLEGSTTTGTSRRSHKQLSVTVSARDQVLQPAF